MNLSSQAEYVSLLIQRPHIFLSTPKLYYHIYCSICNKASTYPIHSIILALPNGQYIHISYSNSSLSVIITLFLNSSYDE